MKKSNGLEKLALFIVVVGVLCGLGYYYFFLRDTKTFDGGILPTLNGDKVDDYKNGIYSFKTNLDRTKTLLKGCVVSSIDDYIVVINEDYYLYHGNCLNMVYVNSGKTENLKIEKDNNSKYYIKLDDKIYSKDNTLNKIEVNNNVTSTDLKLSYDSLKYIAKYSEYPGYYYSFEGDMISVDKYHLAYNYNKESNSFVFSITNGMGLYSKNVKSAEDIPYFALLGKNLVLLDKNKIGNGYKAELFVYSGENKTYDYNSMFPLNINGNIIDASWNRIFRYDDGSKIAYVLFSKTDNICDFSNNNVYYEFKMNYDYTKNGFKIPDLYKKGSNEKDCNYAKKYYLKEG